MSEEKNSVKNVWKYIVTGVTCAIAGAGVMLGADASKVQETLTKAQSKQVAIQTAEYAVNTFANSVTIVSTPSAKKEAIKTAIKTAMSTVDTIIASAKDVKNTVTTEIKEAVVVEKDQTAKDVTATKEAVKKEVKKDTKELDKTVKDAKEVKEVTKKKTAKK